MDEIEVKILEIDPEFIIDKLLNLGAIKSFDGEMDAMFFDFSDLKIKDRGDVLRVRQEGNETRLTYKALISKEGTKIMRELETTVEDKEILQQILEALGLQIVKRTRKHRIQYELNNTHIVIDRYKDALDAIPPFLEIEAPDTKHLYQMVKQLGYKPEDCLSWDTGDLIKHYRIKLS